MYLSKTIRIYPNNEQKQLIEKYLEACTYTYSFFYDYAVSNNDYDIVRWKKKLYYIIKGKKDPVISSCEYIILTKVLEKLHYSLQRNIANESLTGTQNIHRKPNFRTIKIPCTLHFESNPGRKIVIPIFGKIKYRGTYDFSGLKTFGVSIKKGTDGTYSAVVLIEQLVKFLPKTYKSIGIDLGIRKLITTSDNEQFIPMEKISLVEAKISNLQSKIKNKKNESKNKDKLQKQINKLYTYRKNYVRDLIQKVTTDLVRRFDVIYMEDLSINDLIYAQNIKTIRRKLLINSFGYIKETLQYKCKMYGKKLILVDRFYPSSQICSNCGFKHNPGTSEKYICPICGLVIDRDYNAAKNILNYKNNMEDSPKVYACNKEFYKRKL